MPGEIFLDDIRADDSSPDAFALFAPDTPKPTAQQMGQHSPKRVSVSGAGASATSSSRRKSFNASAGGVDDGGQGKRTRASGEILNYLIAEFNRNSNPTTAMRKSIAAKTGMPERSVRIWFQNRRAKARKLEKLQKGPSSDARRSDEGDSGDHSSATPLGSMLSRMDTLPVDINEKYSFIQCRCVSVGSWQRIRTGSTNGEYLKDMVNLSPKIIYRLMETTDLLVVLSKKDQEINYFFSGVFQNDKVLFRIFFPIVSIVKSSILNQSQQPGENGENPGVGYTDTLLQIDLTTSPKFAVHFLRDPANGSENPNQWSICEDFSEGQQVALAHTGDGGSQIGHVLTGDTTHLKYLNNFIMAELQSGGSALRNESSISPSQFGADTNNDDSLLHHEFLQLSASNMATPPAPPPALANSSNINNGDPHLHDLLLYNGMAVFNGSGTIDSEGIPERSVDSPGLDLFRTNTPVGMQNKLANGANGAGSQHQQLQHHQMQLTSDIDELDLEPMMHSSAFNDEDFL